VNIVSLIGSTKVMERVHEISLVQPAQQQRPSNPLLTGVSPFLLSTHDELLDDNTALGRFLFIVHFFLNTIIVDFFGCLVFLLGYLTTHRQ
jgi:hypothetical protein